MAKKSAKSETLHEKVVISRIKHKLKSYLTMLVASAVKVTAYTKSLPTRFRTWRKERAKLPRYKSFRLQKRIKPKLLPLPTSGQLIKQSLAFIWNNKRIFAGIFVVHLLIYFVVVRAPIQPDVRNIQKNITSVLQSSDSKLSGAQNGFVTLSAVLGSSGSTQQNGVVAATVLFLFSLVYIWALRQLHNNNKIKVRDAFYQGLTTIVPVGLVVAVVLLELFPFAFASFLYTLARGSGVFVTGFEDLAFFTLTIFIGLLSFYWMTSGIIAAYMATLPGIYPLYALSSARKLVHFQRLRVFRRVLVLPVILGVTYLAMLLLTIRFVPSQTFMIAEIVQLLFIPFVHTYMYKLYRSML